MHIKTLKLQNFRNYEDARFVLDPAVNLICGENGQGKTNLLEAAAACSTMRLFRTAQKKEGLRFGEDAAFICSEFEAQGRENTLELRLSRLRAMEIYKNGVRQKRQSDVQGLLKTVLFCPEDLMLVRGGAALPGEQQTAAALKNLKDAAAIPVSRRAAVALCMERGLISGYDDGTIRPQQTITRAAFAKLMVTAEF